MYNNFCGITVKFQGKERRSNTSARLIARRGFQRKQGPEGGGPWNKKLSGQSQSIE